MVRVGFPGVGAGGGQPYFHKPSNPSRTTHLQAFTGWENWNKFHACVEYLRITKNQHIHTNGASPGQSPA